VPLRRLLKQSRRVMRLLLRVLPFPLRHAVEHSNTRIHRLASASLAERNRLLFLMLIRRV